MFVILTKGDREIQVLKTTVKSFIADGWKEKKELKNGKGK